MVDREQRASLAYLVAAVLYLLSLPLPHGASLAALIGGAAAGLVAARSIDALAAGGLAGLTALLMLSGYGLPVAAGIMVEAGGWILPVLLPLYHFLAPGLVAAGARKW